jgi:hypothetical protein
MIGKVPDQGKSFRGVVDYLLFGKKGEPRPERVAWTETRNLLVDQPRKAATLMRLTARKSKRVKKPVYHCVISWRHDERPDDNHMRQVADTTCQDLGLEEYQRLYVAHRDTDHHHVHIVVNRVHPETGTAWKNSHDYRRIEVSLRRQAEAMGMDYVPGRHNDPERFRGRAKRPLDREHQRGRRLGEPLQSRWDDATRAGHRDQLQQLFAQAASWEELDRALAAKGLNLTRKGQGLVLCDQTGTMKLSDLGRNVRLKGLEERFGKAFTDYDQARSEAALRKPDERSAAFEEMANVGAQADMTYYLYRAGIASRDEVERSLAAKNRAREALDQASPLAEQLTRKPLARQEDRDAPAPPAPSRTRPRSRDRGR